MKQPIEQREETTGAAPMMINYVPDSVEGVTEPDMVEASEYYRFANGWERYFYPIDY